MEGTTLHRTKVAAARGFQASGVEIARGQQVYYEAEGRWSTNRDGTTTDANGRSDNSGRLIGVVMNEYELGKPFFLGAKSSFSSPVDGRLYLRCHDAFHELADNDGHIVVRFSLQ